MIKLQNISKNYGKMKALKNINYTFKKGKIYVLKGESGSGKTTLLNILSGIDLDFNGKYIYNDKKVSNIRKETDIGYIMQCSLLILKLTIMENLKFVCSDEKKILYYAKLFGVTEILKKYPNQVSGGERQRIAIIRALLKSNDIILADEPTASLDLKNAKIIAKEFEKLKTLNKIVIISTHETCFDEIADEIININYGEIEIVTYNKTQKNQLVINQFDISKDNFKKIDSKFIKTKLKSHNSKRFTVICTILLTIFFLLVGFKENFKNEYFEIIETQYPVNTFYVDKKLYEGIKDLADFRVYDNYIYKSSNDLNFISLPFKYDSIFINGENIIFGTFPTKDYEVLINKKAYQSIFKDKDYESGINKKINIDDMSFVISGIITDDNNKLSVINDSHPFYDINNSQSFILVPYQNIKVFGYVDDKDVYFLGADNLFDNNLVINSLKNRGINVYWDSFVSTYSENINFVFNIGLIVLFFIGILLFLFVNNEITFRMYLRKKEIGYFQIFNIHKKRICKNIILEYYIQFIKILIYSLLTMLIITIILFWLTSFYIMPMLTTLISYSFVFLIYTFVLIFFPVYRFLKEKIIKLIYD